jgi:hypothetical protein
MLPVATIKQCLEGRLRLQIQSRKGDAAYFEQVASRLKSALAYRSIAASALTGSLLIEDEACDLEAVRSAADAQGLFTIRAAAMPTQSLAQRIVIPIRGANRHLTEISGGVLDLPGMIFLSLLAVGLWELAIGNFKRLPWYTAIWYAFGLFSKAIFDELKSEMQ